MYPNTFFPYQAPGIQPFQPARLNPIEQQMLMQISGVAAQYPIFQQPVYQQMPMQMPMMQMPMMQMPTFRPHVPIGMPVPELNPADYSNSIVNPFINTEDYLYGQDGLLGGLKLNFNNTSPIGTSLDPKASSLESLSGLLGPELLELLSTNKTTKTTSVGPAPPPKTSKTPKFNEEAYLAANKDVAEAVKNGTMESGLFHYIHFGNKENRSLNTNREKIQFDEAGYLTRNKDVAAAVKSGQFASGLEHYMMFGQKEGRNPS